jgi:hypothetical protein
MNFVNILADLTVNETPGTYKQPKLPNTVEIYFVVL